ncbi:MAG: bifunctional phosphoribosyl-AMP cyclohydrolase/phosphoribosyl-ATP diphosphatase HisIE [Candidatus Bathyarchaeum sp.]|nr:MAG: bifunctional phosphoribosyl-AMP cyclohydrolase/phosphoribosyl-ATP diphosphatase HisIE [Candidatus Bathyarchaeum sp.]
MKSLVLKLDENEIKAFIEKVNFGKGNGLVPVVVQDASNNRVLMQAYMNEEALRLTLASGRMHFWSRTKGRIWMKGEESKHYSLVQNAVLDCDDDAILFKVQQIGSVCHTGEETCFHKPLKAEDKQGVDAKMLERLFEVIKERIRNPSEKSYVSRLTSKGEDAVLQKIGEEAVELILAVKADNPKEVTHEAADVIFHILVAFAQKGYNLNSIFEELDRRHKRKTSPQI